VRNALGKHFQFFKILFYFLLTTFLRRNFSGKILQKLFHQGTVFPRQSISLPQLHLNIMSFLFFIVERFVFAGKEELPNKSSNRILANIEYFSDILIKGGVIPSIKICPEYFEGGNTRGPKTGCGLWPHCILASLR